MKLFDYTNEGEDLDIYSAEEFNEVVGKLEAVNLGNRAVSRLVSLEALNLEDSPQRDLALEVILSPLGGNASDFRNVTAESLGAKVKKYSAKAWETIRKIIATVIAKGKQFSMWVFRRTAKMTLLHDTHSFYNDYEKVIEDEIDDKATATKLVKQVKDTLVSMNWDSFPQAYTTNIVSDIADGSVNLYLAFLHVKITQEGSDSKSESAPAASIPDSKDMGKIFIKLKKLMKISDAQHVKLHRATSGTKDDQSYIKRMQAISALMVSDYNTLMTATRVALTSVNAFSDVHARVTNSDKDKAEKQHKARGRVRAVSDRAYNARYTTP